MLDGGTGFLKVGYAGNNSSPVVIEPSIVGRPILRTEEKGDSNIQLKEKMFGNEAAAARSMLQITYPMENGIITEWKDMEDLWSYIFEEKLKIDPQDRKILLTEPPGNPLANRIHMCEVMFEKFKVEGVYVATQAVLALYAQGKWSSRHSTRTESLDPNLTAAV